MTEFWISKVRISSAWGCSPRTWGREEIRSEGVSSFVEAFMITMADLLVFTLLPSPSVDLLSFLMLLPLPLPFLWDHLSRSRWRVRALTSMWNAPYVTTSRKKIRQEGNARHEFLGRLPVRFTVSDISS